MTTATVEAAPPVFIEIHDSSNVIGMASPDLSVVEVITAPTPFLVQVVPSSAYLEVIDTAIRGATGPTGPAGLVKVTHGSDPNVPRPDAPLVYWVGTVTPLNADPDDLLMLKT